MVTKAKAHQWDEKTLLSVIARVNLVRTMNPDPKIGEAIDAEKTAIYYAGWDDGLDVVLATLRKMKECLA